MTFANILPWDKMHASLEAEQKIHKCKATASPSSHQLRRRDANAQGEGVVQGAWTNTVYVENGKWGISFVTDVEIGRSWYEADSFPSRGILTRRNRRSRSAGARKLG